MNWKKNLMVALSIGLIVALMLTGCTSSQEAAPTADGAEEASEKGADTPAEEADQDVAEDEADSAGEYPPVDLNPTEAMGVSPEGEKAIAPSALEITEDEAKELAEGGYSAAFSYHTQSDQCNQTKVAAAKEMLDEWGVETVSVTAAEFKAEEQINDIESAMALGPDLLYVIPVDPDTAAAALETVKGTDTKIIFMENIASGFTAGEDYVACVSSDSYGNGKAAADILAEQIGYEGNVAMIFYDMDYFVTNERDRGFKETIESTYPDIEIVMEAGFADPNNTNEVADGVLAAHPDLDGIYASWDIPAEGAITSANSLGLDIVITCCDLGDNAARLIAENGMVRGTGAPRSHDQGQGEALAGAYALLGKELPSTYITPPALPVVRENVMEAYEITYHADAPDWLLEAYESGEAA